MRTFRLIARIILLLVFAIFGTGVLLERRWEAVPLGLLSLVIAAFALFRIVKAMRGEEVDD